MNISRFLPSAKKSVTEIIDSASSQGYESCEIIFSTYDVKRSNHYSLLFFMGVFSNKVANNAITPVEGRSSVDVNKADDSVKIFEVIYIFFGLQATTIYI